MIGVWSNSLKEQMNVTLAFVLDLGDVQLLKVKIDSYDGVLKGSVIE